MARRFRRILVRLFPALLALFGTGGCTLIAATGLVDFSSTPAAANPLSCKLLKASAYAYRVNAAGAISPDDALAKFLGESGEAYAVVSSGGNQSDSDRDAAYLWLSGKEAIIAFRGTLPYNPNATDSAAQALALQDWINDADFAPQADPDFGPVHAGFLASFDNLWPGIQKQLQAWQAAGKLDAASTVYVTGHSKGGALARLAALKLKTDKLLPVTEVDTFGAPRVGGAVFAAKYAAAGIRDQRYENQDDVVPHVPLNDMELTVLPLLQKALALSGKSGGDYVSVG
ncbi:MAG TPA: Mbeg1-like protein, partial [Gammaproteobacteria bacterium]|nr:Mbeg1-like protein [Gammaproteobacteria bacterium]